MLKWQVQYLNDFKDEWVTQISFDLLHEAEIFYKKRLEASYWPRWRIAKITPEVWYEAAPAKRI